MTQHANLYRWRGAMVPCTFVNVLLVWINKACGGLGAHNVAGIIKHLLDTTSPNIIFIWSGKVILVSVLSNKCILLLLSLLFTYYYYCLSIYLLLLLLFIIYTIICYYYLLLNMDINYLQLANRGTRNSQTGTLQLATRKIPSPKKL